MGGHTSYRAVHAQELSANHEHRFCVPWPWCNCSQGIITKFHFTVFHFKQFCILFGYGIFGSVRILISASSSSSSRSPDRQTTNKLWDQTELNQIFRFNSSQYFANTTGIILAFNFGRNPIPPFSERSRIIFSRPANAPPQINRIFAYLPAGIPVVDAYAHLAVAQKQRYLQSVSKGLLNTFTRNVTCNRRVIRLA